MPAGKQTHGAPGAPLISFEGVCLGYGSKEVLTDLRFTIHQGDYIGIVGPNGAGKTTLLKAVLGVIRPLRGRVTRHGEREAHRCGYVPQLNTIDDTYPLTVLDVVLMGRYPLIGVMRRPGKADRERALHALEQVGIADLAPRLFRDLSGGQRQRALMARALASDPSILVLDEPTNDMDIAGERATMELIDRLHHKNSLTVLVVSHILNVLVPHVRRIAFLGAGDFRLLPIDEAITEEHLERLYQTPITVTVVDGRRVVLW
ncbi:MAG TPA: metal ABC transporter ATP-binding protein [Armatimonadota bacterium]|nr:metal ABC transporter ATP-binding protein [Armatimonadota bacterium]HPO71309.1 metal ABC transporter ATP-binding protein [Armatimonadota bacterium]